MQNEITTRSTAATQAALIEIDARDRLKRCFADQRELVRKKNAAVDNSKASVEAARKEYIAQLMRQHPQVGQLNGGKFYAHIGINRIYFESFFIGRVIDRLAEHAKR